MGRPWQKWRTSEIHCRITSVSAALFSPHDPFHWLLCDRSRLIGGDNAYLLLDVIKGIGRVDGKADENDVGIRVGERTEAIVIFLAGGIP